MKKICISLIALLLIGFAHIKHAKAKSLEMNHTMTLELESIQQNKKKVEPLFYIDGHRVTKVELDKINADNLESFTVVKDELELKKYGEEGKHGVILITTKKNANKNADQPIKMNSNGTFDIRSISKDKKPLVVIDGEISEDKDILYNIDTNTIKEVSVLKGDSATSKYGNKGKNGVILITLKKENKTSIMGK